jgi:hypothetical protein
MQRALDRSAYKILVTKLERNQQEGQGVTGRIILKCIQKIRGGSVNRSNLFQDRDRGRTFVNIVMNH